MTVQINQSTVIDAPIDRVWSILRDFNSHADWHPAISHSEIDDHQPADKVSAVRCFRLQDGAELRERLLYLSDCDYSLSYCLTQSPIPLHDYVAEVKLKPITDTDQTFCNWRSSFSTPAGREQELKQLVEQQIYQAGFDAIQRRLQQAPADSPGLPAIAAKSRDQSEVPSEVRLFSFAAPHPPDIISQAAPSATANAEIRAAAIIVDQYGDADQLHYRDVTVPPPAANEVRIRHRAIGVNYIDIYCRTGFYGFLQPPGGLGMEASGEVTELGATVDDFRIGDRVAYAAPPVGAYSQLRNIDAAKVVAIPDNMSFEQAAAIMLKGMTAEFLLHRVYPLKAGDVILVHAAAGGVGLLLCQWANALGASVIGTVSSDEKAALAAANGCHHPIVYSRDDFVALSGQITAGRGVDAVFDAVGKSTFADSMQVLRDRGHMISYGQADQPLGKWDIDSMTAKSLTLSRPNFGSYTNHRDQVLAICKNLFAAFDSGILNVHIGQRFDLADAAAAHRALQARGTVGSTILIPAALEQQHV